MKYIQEKYARDLYDELARRLSSLSTPTEIKVQGAGVNWGCFAKTAERSCKIHCFDHHGQEFLSLFKQNEQEIASGRTDSQTETVKAIEHWLNGDLLDILYDRFQFVDRQKREFIRIRGSVLRDFPDLVIAAPNEIVHWGSSLYYLWFRTPPVQRSYIFMGRTNIQEQFSIGTSVNCFVLLPTIVRHSVLY